MGILLYTYTYILCSLGFFFWGGGGSAGLVIRLNKYHLRADVTITTCQVENLGYTVTLLANDNNNNRVFHLKTCH